MGKTQIIICAPGNVATGGPEALHQLAHEMKALGANCGIMYYPFGRSYTVSSVYSCYDVNVLKYPDDIEKGSIVIFPETGTRYMKYFRDSQSYVWWLSIDNYFGKKYIKKSPFWLPHHAFRCLRGRKRFLFSLKRRSGHLVQSEYARIFLEERGISSLPLSDYLREEHVQALDKEPERENIILFNPRKGMETTRKLLASMPGVTAVPLVNMGPGEIRDLFCRAKLYMDFGNHPGKDRMPREAVMAGCCLITGQRGSAGNMLDLAIPGQYKLDESAPDFIEKWCLLVSDIFRDFASMSHDFALYRQKILTERAIFKEQTQAFLEHVAAGDLPTLRPRRIPR